MRYGFLLAVLCLLCASCTERRRADTPIPDGDTIEVVISDRVNEHATDARRVIMVGPEATPADSAYFDF